MIICKDISLYKDGIFSSIAHQSGFADGAWRVIGPGSGVFTKKDWYVLPEQYIGIAVGLNGDVLRLTWDGRNSVVVETLTTISGADFIGLVYASDQKRIVAITNDHVYTSVDGTEWSAPIDIGMQPNGIAYGNSHFAIAGAYKIQYSLNGTSWANPTETGTTSHGLKYIGFTNNRFYVTGMDGINWSTNAESWHWSLMTEIPNNASSYVAYGNNKFVIGGYSGDIHYSNTGFSSWSTVNTSADVFWEYPTFGNDTFVILPRTGAHSATSPDGVSWTLHDIPQSNDMIQYYSVQYHEPSKKFVALTYNFETGETCFTFSADGVTWSNFIPISQSGSFYWMCFVN